MTGRTCNYHRVLFTFIISCAVLFLQCDCSPTKRCGRSGQTGNASSSHAECSLAAGSERTASSLSTSKKWALALLYTSVINLTSLSGILFKPIIGRALFPWLLIWMIGLGVGSMFSVSIMQLIPESLDVDTNIYRSRILVIIGSIYVFYLTDRLTCIFRYKNTNSAQECCFNDQCSFADGKRSEFQQNNRQPPRSKLFDFRRIPTVVWLIVLCDGLHNFVDGLAISAALSAGYKDGFAIFLAILFEEIPCEIGDFAVFMKSGLTLRRALIFNFASSMTNYLGIVVGFMIADSGLIRSWIYGIAAGMFLYISLGVLLAELNDQERAVAQCASATPSSEGSFDSGSDIQGAIKQEAARIAKMPSKGRLVAVLLTQNFGILSGCFIQILIMVLTE